MDLDQLHTFLEIVRLKSFSKAAQTCFRTQPAVSAQVRQLEQELNASLFDRLGAKIALTPAGDLAGVPLLMPKTGITRSRLTEWLEPVEEDVHISMELDSTEMIKRFVMAGLGVGFLASSYCREEVAAGRLVAIPAGPDSIA